MVPQSLKISEWSSCSPIDASKPETKMESALKDIMNGGDGGSNCVRVCVCVGDGGRRVKNN